MMAKMQAYMVLVLFLILSAYECMARPSYATHVCATKCKECAPCMRRPEVNMSRTPAVDPGYAGVEPEDEHALPRPSRAVTWHLKPEWREYQSFLRYLPSEPARR